MNYKDLQHGDVLLFNRRQHQSITVRLIRLITGSQFTHCGIVVKVDGQLYVLEQMNERMHSRLDFYYAKLGETVVCSRPKFTVDPNVNILDFYRENYGYTNIIDCAINHFMHRITFGKWEFRPILVPRLKAATIICSALVATVLQLDKHATWCKYLGVVEPDDYANHTETFDILGEIEFALKDDNIK
jgi:hypothetical protein